MRDASELFRPILSRVSGAPDESPADGKNKLLESTSLKEKDRLNPYAIETRLSRAVMLRKTEGKYTILQTSSSILSKLFDLCYQFSSKYSKKQTLKTRSMKMSGGAEVEAGAAKSLLHGVTGFKTWEAGSRPSGNSMMTRCKNYVVLTTLCT